MADGTVLSMSQVAGGTPVNRALNLLLLAEGFTESEQSSFDAAAASFANAFLNTPPFDTLMAVINVFKLNVASVEPGADDPVTSDGGLGTSARTFFDASFGQNGIRRLLVCDNALALTTAAAALPEFTAAMVVVNSTIYGGSGGSVPVYSLAAGATEIAMHEIGHSWFHLADEYPYYADPVTPEPDRAHHPPLEPSEANVTINGDRATLKWRESLTAGVPVPSMTNPDCATLDRRLSPFPAGTVGLFEGAHYFRCRVFRPEFDCKMRTIGLPFCRVCRAAIVRQLALLLTTT
jgi:hypothetical protein